MRVAAQQDRRRHRQTGQLVGAEMTHDRSVGEEVERLGDERSERRHRQPEDLPVVRGRASHPEGSTARRTPGATTRMDRPLEPEHVRFPVGPGQQGDRVVGLDADVDEPRRLTRSVAHSVRRGRRRSP